MSTKNVDLINPFVIVAGSLSFVAGLAWNEAIQSSISDYYPAETKKNTSAKFMYALLVTVIIIIMAIFIKYLNDATTQIRVVVSDIEKNKKLSNIYSTNI